MIHLEREGEEGVEGEEGENFIIYKLVKHREATLSCNSNNDLKILAMTIIVEPNALFLNDVHRLLKLQKQPNGLFIDYLTLEPLTEFEQEDLSRIRNDFERYLAAGKISEGMVKFFTIAPLRNIGKIMKDVKAATSTSYRESLINSLKDSEHEKGYIAVMLELDEEGYDAKIFRSALEEVVEARKRSDNLSETAQQYYEQLDKILAETGGAEIIKLVEFLDALGYRINLVDKD